MTDVDLDFEKGPRFYAAFVALSVVSLAAAFDATSISVTLPTITQDLHGTALDAFWAGTSFLLTSTVFQPSWVVCSHALGRRTALLFSMLLFALGAILCGVSRHFTLLLAGRCVQGLGGGGIMVLSEVIVTDLVPLRQRGKWITFITLTWAIGSVTGPVIGGAFAQDVSWRWIFWVNLPIVGVAFFMVVAFLRLTKRKPGLMQKLGEIDYLGSFLFIASLTSFLVPITWGGVQYPWSSWHTLAPLILGLVGLAVFFVYEAFAKVTFIPLGIFGNRSSVINHFGLVVHGMVLWSTLYYLPLYYEAVQQYSLVISGVALFPETLTVVPAAIVVGVIVSVTGRYRWALWVGWVLTTFGCGLLILLGAQTTLVQWIFLNVVVGLGTGLLFPAMAITAMASAPEEHVAMCVGMIVFFRLLGQTLGVAIGGVVFQNRLKAYVLQTPSLSPFAGQYSGADATALVQVLRSLPQQAQQTMDLKVVYAKALQDVWAVMCGLSGAALIASLFVKGYTMDRTLQTEQAFDRDPSGKDASDKELSSC